LCGTQRGKSVAGTQRLEFSVQTLVLADFGTVLGDFRQNCVVRLAQFRAVHHGVQVASLAPGTVQPLIRVFQWPDEIVPVWRCGIGGNARDQCAVFLQ